MFHLHRKYLVHKIWKARVICIGDQVSEKTFGILKQSVFNFLGAWDVNTLVLLLKVLNREEQLCLYTSSPSSRFEDQTRPGLARLRYLIARVWRWPDLKENHELKHIESDCNGDSMGDCLCVNPFHFSRIAKRDIPYKSIHGTREKDCEDSGFSCASKEPESVCEQTLSSESTRKGKHGYEKPWVEMAYWEGNVRVGTKFHGYNRTINIYESLGKGSPGGFCLTDLERTHEMKEPTRLVFQNIGDGVQISLEDGNIWIHNRSQSPVFINGELLQTLRHARAPRVEKLPSGYALKVFSRDNISRNVNKRRNDPHCLRVSFVKGFGNGYKRQYITNCPCWVEMYFFVPES